MNDIEIFVFFNCFDERTRIVLYCGENVPQNGSLYERNCNETVALKATVKACHGDRESSF